MRSNNQDIILNIIICDIQQISKVISNVIFKFDIQIFFGYLPNTYVHHTMSALGALTLIILFVKMLKFLRICFFKEQSFVKQNRESFGILKNILHFDMESSNFI
jgi:hypothetical protein